MSTTIVSAAVPTPLEQVAALKAIPLRSIGRADYQRDLNHKRVQGIVDNFDENLLDAILVSQRDDEFYVVDGAHRIAALEQLGQTHAVARVVTGLTYQQEAGLFAARNAVSSRLTVSQPQRLRALLEAGDEGAWAFQDLLTDLDLHLEFEPGYADPLKEGVVRAIATCRDIARHHGLDVLKETLENLRDGFMPDLGSFDARLVRGMALFVTRWRGAYDRRRMTAKLREQSPKLIINTANMIRHTEGVRSTPAIAKALTNAYNAHLKDRSKYLGERATA